MTLQIRAIPRPSEDTAIIAIRTMTLQIRAIPRPKIIIFFIGGKMYHDITNPGNPQTYC